VADTLHLPLKNEILDCLIGGEIIEHLLSPELFLAHLQSVIKENGSLIITTVNKERLSSKAPSFQKFKEMRAKGTKIVYNTAAGDEHVFELTNKELVTLVESANFHVEALHVQVFLGLYFLPFLFKMLPHYLLSHLGRLLLSFPLSSRVLSMDMAVLCSKL
jgi:2-polyprenyl-3-methyl-5-hydroxy-6-metoxy-1,4-benzoquinol methylase